ncbi:hypothetical protein GCM10020221_16120 [Streptomyces thioluteus]|uniref:Glycoside hydrolase family 3 N-terminal domain-containing protein n=1 Tax=Streptomyces thioluteus TaxID=66431 RepID=A0ABN3WNJ5_STRTU
MDTLTRDALTVLQPGFTGTTAPDWLLRRLGEGLASVGLFGRNIASPEQLAALTAALRAEREDVLVAIDEEGGDVTRLEVRTGSSFPGNLALGAVDDTALTRAVRRGTGPPARRLRGQPQLGAVRGRQLRSRQPGHRRAVARGDPGLVAAHRRLRRGHAGGGVATCASTSPRHAHTSVDSQHHDMPRIDVGPRTLEETGAGALPGGRRGGTKAVMSAHICCHPSARPAAAAMPRSERCVHGLLHGLLRAHARRAGSRFDGLIVTDGMEMRAIADGYGIERGASWPWPPARRRDLRGGWAGGRGGRAAVARRGWSGPCGRGELSEERLAEARSGCGGWRLGGSARVLPSPPRPGWGSPPARGRCA